MNILFLTIGRMNNIEDYGIYTDLLRHLRDSGHRVFTVSANERRTGLKTTLKTVGNVSMLRVKIGNITKCGIIEKGVSTLQIERKFKSAVKKYYGNIKFDWVLYSTPPITFASVISFIKKRDNARSYLLLKDIFPQNALDLGMMSKKGIKGLIYRCFRNKEKKLYSVSDRIGCMSRANVDFILSENKEIEPSKVEVFPNCIEVRSFEMSEKEAENLRLRYALPTNGKVFVCGGNSGRPQSVPFMVECLKACSEVDNAFFVVAGSGTDRHYLESYVKEYEPGHVKLLGNLPKEEYDRMIACCDVGLIFLDHRFKIPNFPSRLLSYMQGGLPVLACTDPNTDVGKTAVDGGFGWWCESDDVEKFVAQVKKIVSLDLSEYKEKSTEYLREHYSVEKVYQKCFAPIFDTAQANNKRNEQ